MHMVMHHVNILRELRVALELLAARPPRVLRDVKDGVPGTAAILVFACPELERLAPSQS